MKYCILFITFLLSIPHIQANNPNIISFNRFDYKSGNKNWSISGDQKGVIYVGNDIGLLEFDGVEWKIYKGGKNNVVRAVYAQSDSTIFSGGYEEFGVWNREISGELVYTSLSAQLPPATLHNGDIWRILEINNQVYFQSFNAIFVYKNGVLHQLNDNRNVLLLNQVRNELWIQEMGGALQKIENDEFIEIPNSYKLFHDTEVKSILPYQENQYLIITSSMGIYRYDGEHFYPWNTSEELKRSNINCAIQSNRGNYIVGTILNGVFEINPNGKIINMYTTDTYLNNNTVLAIYEDSFNNVWLGLDRGISCIQYSDDLSFYTEPVGKNGTTYAAALFVDKLFIGTNQGVFYIDTLDIGDVQSVYKFKPIAHTKGQVWNLAVFNDKLYCAHNNSLITIDQNLKTTINPNVGTGVFDIKQLSKTHLILGTYTGVKILDLRTNVIQAYPELTEPINKIEIDHLGNIWLQHMNKGAYKAKFAPSYDNMSIVEYSSEVLPNQIPYSLNMFKIKGRIAFLGDDLFYTYDDINGQIVEEPTFNRMFKGIKNLKNVVNISPSTYWVIGNNVIYCVNYDEQNSAIDAVINVNYKNFSLVDNYENIVPLNSKWNLICLDKGFILSSAKALGVQNVIPDIYINKLAASDANGVIRYLDYRKKNRLGAAFNNLSVSFGSNLPFYEQMTYQYNLSGLNSGEWIEVPRVNTISFDRLLSGKYVLQLRAVNKFGEFSPTTTINFTIAPIWYRSAIAYVVYCILILLIIIGITSYIQYRYKKLHIRKMRIMEAKRLNEMNERLQKEVQQKNAELLSQTSSIIRRNETINTIKNDIETYISKQNTKSAQQLYQRVLDKLNSGFDPEEDWKTFLIKFEQKHTDFFKELKELYPQLTPNDLKLCACLKLNLESKDIASLMNISVRAVENNRSRLRKKLNIPSNIHLADFFISI